MRRLEISKGDKYNKLTVVKELSSLVLPGGQTKRNFKFKCDCGNYTETLLDNVRRNKTRSCGCEEIRNRITHGLSWHPLYFVWTGMHERCENHQDYFGRGIKVAKVWQGENGLENFIKWGEENKYKKGLQIDRKNNYGNYTPKNCRFVTRSVNQRNRRITTYVKHPITKKQVVLADLMEEMAVEGLTLEIVRKRIIRNISVLKSVNVS